MGSMDDSGFDSDHKYVVLNETLLCESQKVESQNMKSVSQASDLQKKIEKQRERKKRKQIIDEQPKRALLPRSRDSSTGTGSLAALEMLKKRTHSKDIKRQHCLAGRILQHIDKLNIPMKSSDKSSLLLDHHDHHPLVAVVSDDDSEEDEFDVPRLSKEAYQEMTEQLIKDGYNLDLDPDDEDLDLIPPRPLHERCGCCPSITWIPQKCAIQ